MVNRWQSPSETAGQKGCFPRERGWTVGDAGHRDHGIVLPARAGVDRPATGPAAGPPGASRASGGGPFGTTARRAVLSCFPRERGWTALAGESAADACVLPARAGVDRRSATSTASSASASRASGGGPAALQDLRFIVRCFPRERGWTAGLAAVRACFCVLPARAGVDRSPRRARGCSRGASRASGGGPTRWFSGSGSLRCFPRERGWTVPEPAAVAPQVVLPARAGVDRWGRICPPTGRCASRASGGGPSTRSWLSRCSRCFPRERGWTGGPGGGRVRGGVLPARAGVDRRGPCPWRRTSCASRASGGGPSRALPLATDQLCFPRERGWTDAVLVGDLVHRVLPARAGVDRWC